MPDEMRVAFFGTPEFAAQSLHSIVRSSHEIVLVVAQPNRPSGRGMSMRKPPTAALALELGIPLDQPPKMRDEAFLERLRSIAPEIGVVVAYGKILPEVLLGIPRHGFVNVHASLLPKYRGAAPIQRAIENGERETGVTIMRVDRELDHGPMILTAATPIGPEEMAPSVMSRLAGMGGGAGRPAPGP